MKKNLTLVCAVLFLFAANVQADFVNVYSDSSDYKNAVVASDWSFTYFNQTGGDNSFTDWAFGFKNEADGTGTGTIKATNFNGNGKNDGKDAKIVGLELQTSHNSANDVLFSFDGNNYIDSFFFSMNPHSNSSSTGTISLWATYDLDGEVIKSEEVTFNPVYDVFFGIALEEGAILKTIEWSITNNKNTGFFLTAGFGSDAPASTPEPATLAILGLGLAGLGYARTRRRK